MLSPTDKSTLQTVRSVSWWTEALFCLTITRPSAYHFIPGQFSRLGLPSPAFAPDAETGVVRRAPPPFDVLWRAYSITSAPDSDHLEYYGILVPAGAFTSAVRDLQPGDPILLEKSPNGFLTIDRFTGGDTLWMLATGTGLGPYVAQLRDAAVWQRFRTIVLVHGVRHAREFAYAAELQSLSARMAQQPGMAQLRVVQATTREPLGTAPPAVSGHPDSDAAAWPRLHGRITTLLENGALEQAAGIALQPESARLMLCGNPAMIEETRRLLQQRGFLPVRRALAGHFLTENYW